MSALSIFCKYPHPKQMLDEDEEDEQAVVNVVDSPSQQGGEDTSERDEEDIPLEGDAKASLQVYDNKKGNETVVQTTPAEADLL